MPVSDEMLARLAMATEIELDELVSLDSVEEIFELGRVLINRDW